MINRLSAVDMMAANTTTINTPASTGENSSMASNGRIPSGSSRPGYRARPARPAVTAPMSNRNRTMIEMIIAGTRLCSDRADIKRTINCGTPTKPTPMATKLITAINALTPTPSGPQGLNRLGSSMASVFKTASQPPAALTATTGTTIRPLNIKIPWIRSVQATAL